MVSLIVYRLKLNQSYLDLETRVIGVCEVVLSDDPEFLDEEDFPAVFYLFIYIVSKMLAKVGCFAPV